MGDGLLLNFCAIYAFLSKSSLHVGVVSFSGKTIMQGLEIRRVMAFF